MKTIHWFMRTFIFDERKRSMFLAVVATQVASGRPYADVFKSISRSGSRFYRRLASLSMQADSEYFATHYEPYFGEKITALLQLAQRYNVVPAFIREIIIDKPAALSFWRTVMFRAPTEIFLVLGFLAGSVAFYLNRDYIEEEFGDFSQTFLYIVGEFLVVYQAPLAIGAAAAAVMYLVCRKRPGKIRDELKSVGCYTFYDRFYLVELFTVIRIMTSGGQDMSIRQFMQELDKVFGQDKFRSQQFEIIRTALADGDLFQDAIEKAGLLPIPEHDLFRGLAPTESVAELHHASGAVVEQLRDKLKLELDFAGRNLHFGALLFLGVAMIAVVDITMGGGSIVLNTVDQI